MVLESDQPTGKVKMTGFPVKLAEASARLRRPSPQLSEHAREILMEIDYSPEEIERFKEARVVV